MMPYFQVLIGTDSSWNPFLWHNSNIFLMPRYSSLWSKRFLSLCTPVTVTGKTSSCILLCTLPHPSFRPFYNLNRCISLTAHATSGCFSLPKLEDKPSILWDASGVHTIENVKYLVWLLLEFKWIRKNKDLAPPLPLHFLNPVLTSVPPTVMSGSERWCGNSPRGHDLFLI